ncbi:MAG: T9SS type A sorting domain-containing protein [Bacteroidia bacterium]|nr:T9SS type A sorting domain-containing protein [Bacteroidia bacterium]
MKKKYLLSTIPVFFLATGFFAQTLTWSNPIVVAAGTADPLNRPKIKLSLNNVPTVIWTEAIGPNILYCARKTGVNFAMPVAVAPALDPRSTMMDGPNMTVAGDTVYVIYSSPSSGVGDIYLSKSLNGGQSFSNPVMVNDPGNIPVLPWVSTSPGGNPVCAYMQLDLSWTNPRHVVSTSTNGGATFGSEVDGTLLAPGVVCECCPPSLASKGSKQVLLFRNNNSNVRDIWTGLSNDDGNTFTQSTDIDATNWMVMSCPSSGPEGIISGDSLIAVWMSASTGDERVHVGTMNINTMQSGFNNEINSVPGNYLQNLPTIAGQGDTLGVVWQDFRNGNYDCMFSYSVSGASGLDNQYFYIDSGMTAQYNVDVAYANGTFHFVYQDDTNNKIMYRTASFTSVGLAEMQNEQSVVVAPNPFSKRTTLSFKGSNKPLSVSLFDVSGKLISTYGNISSNEVIVEENFDRGIYFFSAKMQDGKIVKGKFLVQ